MRRNRDPLTLPDESMLTVRQAATICGISAKMLRDQITTGSLKVMYWGKSNEPRIPRWSLRAWQEGELKKPDAVMQLLKEPARSRKAGRSNTRSWKY